MRPWFMLGLVGLGLALLTLQPYSVCPFAVATGVPCPGCGLTRSIMTLLRGDFHTAWRLHPLGPLVAAACVAVAGLRLAEHRWLARNTDRRRWTAPAYVWWAVLGIVLGVWVARFYGVLGSPADVHSPFEVFQTLNRK